MITLDLLVATHKPAGIQRVTKLLLPPIEGVRYIVSWQNHENAPIPPELTVRQDVEIYRFEGNGLSNNRNNALRYCKSDVILITDDDVVLFPEGLQQLREVFEKEPDMQLATFRSEHGDASHYPTNQCVLGRSLPKGYYVSTFEIAFRRSAPLAFCPNLGPGTDFYTCGEDEMFLQAAIRKGLNCIYFPITINAHHHVSTGQKAKFTPGQMRASGLVIRLSYGVSAFPRVLLKAWRITRCGQASLLAALRYTLSGYLSASKFLKENKATLW